MTLLLEDRVTDLEHLMAELVRAQTRTQRQLDQFSREMVEFREESRRSREALTRVQEEIRQAQAAERQADEERWRKSAEAQAVERQADEERWRKSREENEREWRQFRQSLAEISHKMGTLAEDMVAPSIPRILLEVVHGPEPPSMLGVRIRKRLRDGRSQEYDVVATCGNYLLINETKSRLRPEDIPNFIETLKAARTFLPEYADRQVIGALASFYVDPTLVAYGEHQGLIMLGVVDGLMQVLNTPEFRLQTL